MLPQSLGLDEAQSLWQAAHTVPGIFYVVGQDVHVPLYHLLLHFWLIQFGNSVAAGRMLSLLFYLPTILLVFYLGKLTFKESVGLFAAIVFALSPFTNWYGSVIRMYSLLTFFTVLNQIFFMLLYKGDRGREPRYWLGYFLSALFGIYTHYFFWLILMVQAIFVIVYRNLFSKNAFRKFVIVAALLFIALSPWLIYVRSLGGFSANKPKLLPPSTVDVFNTFSNFFFGFQPNIVNTIILSSWPIIMLFLFLALQRNRRVPPEAIYFTASVFIPIAAAAALSHVLSPFYLSRYFIGLFPSLCIAASWFFGLYPKSASKFARSALVGVMLVSLNTQTVNPGAPIKEDYQAVAQYVSEHATARDIVAVSTPFTVYPVEYYYTGEAALTTLPVWNRLQSGAIPSFSTSTLQANLETFQNYEKLWLIASYDQGYQETLRIYLDTHFERLDVEHFSPGLDLYAYRLRYDDATLADAVAIANAVGGGGGGGNVASLAKASPPPSSGKPSRTPPPPHTTAISRKTPAVPNTGVPAPEESAATSTSASTQATSTQQATSTPPSEVSTSTATSTSITERDGL